MVSSVMPTPVFQKTLNYWRAGSPIAVGEETPYLEYGGFAAVLKVVGGTCTSLGSAYQLAGADLVPAYQLAGADWMRLSASLRGDGQNRQRAPPRPARGRRAEATRVHRAARLLQLAPLVLQEHLQPLHLGRHQLRPLRTLLHGGRRHLLAALRLARVAGDASRAPASASAAESRPPGNSIYE